MLIIYYLVTAILFCFTLIKYIEFRCKDTFFVANIPSLCKKSKKYVTLPYTFY